MFHKTHVANTRAQSAVTFPPRRRTRFPVDAQWSGTFAEERCIRNGGKTMSVYPIPKTREILQKEGKGELGDGPYPRSPPERKEPTSQANKRRDEAAGMLDRGRSLWVDRLGTKDGAAVNLGKRSAAPGALVKSQAEFARAAEERLGEMGSCKITLAMAQEDEPNATGWSAATSRLRALSSESSFSRRGLSSSVTPSQWHQSLPL